MSTDYIVASLPTLEFSQPAPISWERLCELCGGEIKLPDEWIDLETQLRNAMAYARGNGEKFARPAVGCQLYWQNRITAAFAENDPLKREELLDKVWWDAAGELTPCASPLGKGALATYAIRLKTAIKRTKISMEKGNEAFDRLTAETKR